MLLLEKFLSLNEIPKLLIIKDHHHHPGYGLMRAFLKSHLQSQDSTIHILCYDNSPQEYTEDIKESSLSLKLYDGFTDPLSWECTEISCNSLPCTYDLVDMFCKIPFEESSVVIVDSLSMVLLHQSLEAVYLALHKLLYQDGDPVRQIICLIHSDVHDEVIVQELEHLATTVLHLYSKDKYANPLCDVTHRTAGGKILKETVRWKMSDEFDIQDIKSVVNNKQLQVQSQNEPDPTSNLTFNLNLNEDEKLSREKLVLPYTRNSNMPGGKIYYEMDNGDDFDEDDPDDDLDI